VENWKRHGVRGRSGKVRDLTKKSEKGRRSGKQESIYVLENYVS